MSSFFKSFIAGLFLVIVFATYGSTAAEEVEQAVVGTWVMNVPGSVGNSVWVWAIHADGSYEFRIQGLGFPPGHKGKMTAAKGKWTLTSTTMDYADGGTYELPDPNTFLATGRLGLGRWSRQTPVHVAQQDQQASQQVVASLENPSESVMDTLLESLSLEDQSTKLTGAHQADINAYLHGLDALEIGRWNEAIQQFTTAIQTKPENPDYLTARGVAYALAQQLKSAEKDLRRANHLRANHKATKMWLATVVGMQGRFSEDQGIYPFATLDEYENVVRRMSHEYGELFFRKAMGDELAVRQARPAHDQAIQSFPTLAKMFVDRVKPAGSRATGGPREGLSTALRQRGIDRYKAGQCAEGYRDLVYAYQANPDDKEVLFYLAECKLKLGSPEGARADYTAVLLEQPNHAKAIVGRALAHAALGDAPAAQQGLAEARAIDPLLGSQYEKQVKKDLANFSAKQTEKEKVALLEQLRKSAQQSAKWKTLIQLAQQVVKVSQHGRLRADERYQLKLTQLRRVTNRRNAAADDFAALGQFLYEQALIVVGEAVEPHARNRPYRPQTEKGQARELEQAEAAVDRALQLNPNHPRALAFKGACRFKRDNDWVSAEKYLSRAIDLDDRDPVIQDLFNIVLDYIAFVQASAAAELRSVDIWEDTHYIYYRYPSEAELRRADELDAIARRLWKKAHRALERAIANAPNSAQAHYYRSILAERDKNLAKAAASLKQALQLDPKYFEAAQRLSTIAHKLRQTQLAYTAQSIATNLVHTSAAPMLKLSWIEFSRTAYQKASKALDIAAKFDPADPRVAAYYGAVAREKGDHALAESWFMAAAALEEVRLSFWGLNVREQNGMEYGPDEVSRLLAINNAAATELNRGRRFAQTTASLDVNFTIYRQTSQKTKYTKSPYGLLPEPREDPARIPEAPTIEALIGWSTIYYAKANVGLQRYDQAMKQFEWAAAFESRKPPTMDQGMVVRLPGLWAKLGMVDLELRRGNVQAASQRMQMYGHPSIATSVMKAEADRLRNAIEAKGFRSGGQTLHDLRDQQRRKMQQQFR